MFKITMEYLNQIRYWKIMVEIKRMHSITVQIRFLQIFLYLVTPFAWSLHCPIILMSLDPEDLSHWLYIGLQNLTWL